MVGKCTDKQRHRMIGYDCRKIEILTLNLLTTTIIAPPSNASKWQMGINSAFKGLISVLSHHLFISVYQ
jgi:hypothetical protein